MACWRVAANSVSFFRMPQAWIPVKKGDVVAEFDRQYMLTRLDDYTFSVSQLEASIRKMKAELEVSRNAHRKPSRTPKPLLKRPSWM